MITNLSLCFSGNWYQLYSYSVPSLSLLSSLVVSNADFIFFFSKFLPLFSITTSVKSGDQYRWILWCLKGLSESGWLFSESMRCWLWCWRPSGDFWPFSTLFPWLCHSSPPPQFFCYNSLWTCVANWISDTGLKYIPIPSSFLSEVYFWPRPGLQCSHTEWCQEVGGSGEGRPELPELALLSWPPGDNIMLKTAVFFMFGVLVTLVPNQSEAEN